VNHFASPGFWECYHRLPLPIRQLADQNYALMKKDPKHPSLRLKKIASALYSARIGLHYRALATETSDGLIWFWIGSHADYDHLLK